MSLIYLLSCKRCDTTLGYSVSLDNDGDLNVSADPCETCIDNAIADAKLIADEEATDRRLSLMETNR